MNNDLLDSNLLRSTSVSRRLQSDTETPRLPSFQVAAAHSESHASLRFDGFRECGANDCIRQLRWNALGQTQSTTLESQDGADVAVLLFDWSKPMDLPVQEDAVAASTVSAPSFQEMLLDSFTRRLAQVRLSTPLDRFKPKPAHSHSEREFQLFRDEIFALILGEAIEDGIPHPVEELISKHIATDASRCRDCLSRILIETYRNRPSIAAGILRCIGRLGLQGIGRWGFRVVDDALRHIDPEVREAAIRALEKWGGEESIRILRGHDESQDWLRAYVNQVIVDLSSDAI